MGLSTIEIGYYQDLQRLVEIRQLRYSRTCAQRFSGRNDQTKQ